MESNILYIIMGITLGLLAIIVVAYLMLRKKMQNSDVKRINSLINDTKEKRYSLDVFYQKLYIKFQKAPFIKRYLYKIRRRLEINNLDDEYLTRMQTAKIITNQEIIEDSRIIERSNGELEGKLKSEYQSLVDFTDPNETRYNIEPLNDFRKRIENFFKEIVNKYPKKDILVVTHAGVSIYAKCYFEGEPIDGNYSKYKLKNCEILKYEN